MPLRTRRRLSALGLGIMLVFCMAACNMELPDSAPTPGTTGTAPRQPATLGGAAPTIDPSRVTGLNGQRIFSADGATPVAARWGYLPGEHPVNAVIDQRVSATLSGYLSTRAAGGWVPRLAPASGGTASACAEGATLLAAAEIAKEKFEAPAVAGVPTLVLSCDIVAATGPFFGERMRSLTLQDGLPLSDSSSVLYTDTMAGTVVDGSAVIADASLRTVFDRVAAALVAGKKAAADSAAGFAAATDDQLRSFLSDSVFDGSGDLVVSVPPGFGQAVGTLPEHRFVALDSDRLSAELSEFGTDLRAAVRRGASYSGPADQPAPLDHLNCAIVPCVALTYDDGPTGATDTLLATLKEKNASATFFMIGGKVQQLGDVAKRVAEAGQEIGSHTQTHAQLTKLSVEAIREQVDQSVAEIRDATGRTVTLLRPPYGAVNQKVRDAVGLPLVLWDVDPRDWATPPPEQLLAGAVDVPQIGSIVLEHDSNAQTVAMAGQIIDGLRGRGFSLATITQLMRGTLPPPATPIYHGPRN